MRIISRAEWGARAPTRLYRTTWANRHEFVVHYTNGGPTQSVRSVQDWCMDGKGHSDIDYNALVDRDGRVYEGRTGIWLTVGSHNLNRNTRGVGACYLGDSSTELTAAAKRAFRWLYEEANRRRRAAGVAGDLDLYVHSDHRPTSCPGWQLRDWVKAGMPTDGLPDLGGGAVYGTVVKGVKGDAAAFVQGACRDIDPKSLPVHGIDEHWGDETSEWVERLFGGTGDVFGPSQNRVYLRKLAQKYAGRDGEQGPPGEPGKDGRTPTQVRLAQTADVIAYETEDEQK